MQLPKPIVTGLTLCLVAIFFHGSAIAQSEKTKVSVKTNKAKKKSVKKKKKKLTENDYILGKPDKSIDFPSQSFEKAKALKKEKKLEEAEEILLNNLESARLAGRGTPKLGKYLIRLNNVLFARGKDKAAIKYGVIGVKLLALDNVHAKELSGWLVNGKSYLAMSYDRQRKFKKAVTQYKDAIDTAEQAPEGKVSKAWIKTLKQQRRKALSNLRKETDS